MLTDDFQERCLNSLDNVISGLDCLMASRRKYSEGLHQAETGGGSGDGSNITTGSSDSGSNYKKEGATEEELPPPPTTSSSSTAPAAISDHQDEPLMANCYQPIPLPYSTIIADDAPINTAETKGLDTVSQVNNGNSNNIELSDNTNATTDNNSNGHQLVTTNSTNNNLNISTCLAPTGDNGNGSRCDTQKEQQEQQQMVVPADGVESSSPCGGAGDVTSSSSSVTLSVNLSKTRYDVTSFSAKLELMLLHKAGVVYKMLAQDAVAKEQ